MKRVKIYPSPRKVTLALGVLYVVIAAVMAIVSSMNFDKPGFWSKAAPIIWATLAIFWAWETKHSLKIYRRSRRTK